MVQLSDDCFTLGERLLTVDQALAIIAATIPCGAGIETLPLAQADSRILATDVYATTDLPPFHNSAVDGYAVRLADLGPDPLPILGRSAAGLLPPPLRPSTAMRIFTGAPIPDGADTVFMQEDANLHGAAVRLPFGLARGANTRPPGEDICAGTLALPAGRRLRPQDIALAAALGHATLPLRRPLRVALFSTGDELVDPPAPLAAAQRWDSNRILLALLCRRAGAEITDLGILPDKRQAIAAALEHASAHDLVLTSGGVSVGEEDHVRAAVEQAGRLTFWRVAIKPGRPVALGQIGDALFLGLPGNPAAAFVTFVRLARPLLAALSGATPPDFPTRPVPVAFPYRKKPARREYLRVRIDEQGRAHRHSTDGAGLLTPLTQSHGLLELPEDLTDLEPGQTAAYTAFSELM